MNKKSDHVFYYPHQSQTDRSMLAYIKGSKFSLAIDAGYSAKHVDDFYDSLISQGLKLPDVTVITHWHYDHTFGIHNITGLSIAHRKTKKFLEIEKEKLSDPGYVNILRKEDTFFAKEYDENQTLLIDLLNIQFETELIIDLGKLSARVFHTESPHSEDSVCIYLPDEQMLFLGDATSEDFFNNGYMDKEKLRKLIETIRDIDCRYCILSHVEPLKKQDLLNYLDIVLKS